jgi:SNF2 family DNA or RNA helicase
MPNPAVFAEPWAELSWRPIAVTQVVSLPAERLRPEHIEVSTTPLPPATAIATRKLVVSSAKPRAVSLAIKPLAIRTASYSFRPPATKLQFAQTDTAPAQHRLRVVDSQLPSSARATRLKPPADTVKLEDRLYYLLQPSLETLIGEGALEFPFHPFAYQFEGVAFLYPRVAAVLADEMGLGKTMQAITALRLLLHAGEIKSVLLVCPKPLVTNWRREFAMWAPELPIGVIEGDQAKRRWQWRGDVPVKIANYEVLRRDVENGDLDKGDILLFDAGKPRHGAKKVECPLSFDALSFDLVVIDEAQRIKNRSGTTSQIVRSIRRTRSWALTGTPVENSPDDLVGIFDFVAPGHINREMKPRTMGRVAADYILRRTKDKVLADLPPKLFRDADVELSPEQRASYTLAEEEGVLRLTEMGEGATIQHVFELVLRLKQICNFDPATGESSKLERLVADLEEVAASGRKAIVFSQWVATLAVLEERLRRFGVLEYHGQIPSRQRDGVIDQFMHDRRKHVILMTYGAGGVGLNLQFCGYVFLFDRWWNPAVEDQAINRAHRIGAAGPVTVTRFLTLDTIEERINQVLEEKRELFDTIFASAAGHRSLGFTQQEIFGLFKLRSPQGPINAAA